MRVDFGYCDLTIFYYIKSFMFFIFNDTENPCNPTKNELLDLRKSFFCNIIEMIDKFLYL